MGKIGIQTNRKKQLEEPKDKDNNYKSASKIPAINFVAKCSTNFTTLTLRWPV